MFAERVKNRLKSKNIEQRIAYGEYTFGQLSSEIVCEGLALCSDIKLHRQTQKNKLSHKQELGDFCEQFRYTNTPSALLSRKKGTRPPSHNNPKTTRYPNRYPLKSKRPNFRKNNNKTQQLNKKTNKSLPVCYKCGKIGHYSNKCRTKQKINELNLDEGLKRQLEQVLLMDSDLSEEDESSSSENDSGTISGLEDDECTDGCSCKNCFHKQISSLGINVLTNEENFILELIDKIENPESKRIALEKYIEVAKRAPKQEKIETSYKPYSFKEIMARVENHHIKKEPSVNNLRVEINQVKEELRSLKQRVQILELHKPVDCEYDSQEENSFDEILQNYQAHLLHI